MRRAYDGGLQVLRAGDDAIEVGRVTEPQHYPVPDRTARVSDRAVMASRTDEYRMV